jgi:hypothetical protein
VEQDERHQQQQDRCRRARGGEAAGRPGAAVVLVARGGEDALDPDRRGARGDD